MLGNPVQVAVLVLQDLVQPMHQFHIGVAAQFAEHRGPLNRLIAQTVQLAKQRHTTDFTHDCPPDLLDLATGR